MDPNDLEVKGYLVRRGSGLIEYRSSLDVNAEEYEEHGGIAASQALVALGQVKHLLGIVEPNPSRTKLIP